MPTLPPRRQLPSRPEAERQHQAVIQRRLLRVDQEHAGICRQRVAEWVDLADAVHPLQADDQLPAARVGRGATAVAGVAGLRHEPKAMAGRKAHDLLHIGRGGRAQHGGGRTTQKFAVIDDIALDKVCVCHDACRTKGVAERIDGVGQDRTYLLEAGAGPQVTIGVRASLMVPYVPRCRRNVHCLPPRPKLRTSRIEGRHSSRGSRVP